MRGKLGSLRGREDPRVLKVRKPVEIKKGSRVRASWLAAKPLGTFSLAGAQIKLAAKTREVVGRVTHVYGDHPTDPKNIEVWIAPDDGGAEVQVRSEWIVEVLGA